jgi:acetyl/propionyl-CoA carboxylase alpha subunit
VRVDAGVVEGDEVGTGYDPLIAKLIAHGATRGEALDRLAAALAETEVAGTRTNLPFLRWLVAHPVFRAGEATTAFLAEHPPLSAPPAALPEAVWRTPFRLNLPAAERRPAPDPDAAEHDQAHGDVSGTVTAPMPGTVVRVLTAPGAQVDAREPLVVVEAMKMETPLLAPYAGTVAAVHVAEGDRVAGGAVLVELAD